MAIIGKDLAAAVDLLNRGEVVAIPTETVYGLAGSATNQDAISKIYSVKQRPRNNPLIVHVSGIEFVRSYVKEVPEIASKLADRFWPGPLTLLLPKGETVLDEVTAGLPRVAVRMPNQPLTLELLKMLSFPLAAPSANPYGYISPTTAEDVQKQLGEKINYILDGGSCKRGIESTIVGFDDGEMVIYRKGVITLDDLKKVSPKVRYFQNPEHKHITSGMSLSHYSPKTTVFLIHKPTDLEGIKLPNRVGYIAISKSNPDFSNGPQIILSPSVNMAEAAQKLYQALFDFDQMNLDLIIIEMAPNEGIGIAINDRLTRASDRILG